jgi:anti-sigma B factor antagonist
MEQDKHYDIRQQGNVHVIVVSDLLNESENKKTVQVVKNMIGEGHSRLVIDLGNIGFMNSVGLNFIISCLVSTRQAGGDIVLLKPSVHILNLLQVTKLAPMFHIEDSSAAAVAYFDHIAPSH